MHNNTKVINLLKEIEEARLNLQDLISKKPYNLTDSDIVDLSKSLDDLLSRYHDLIG